MRIYSIFLINRRTDIIFQIVRVNSDVDRIGDRQWRASCVVTCFLSEDSSAFGTDVSGAAGSLGGGSCDSMDFVLSSGSVGFAVVGSGEHLRLIQV